MRTRCSSGRSSPRTRWRQCWPRCAGALSRAGSRRWAVTYLLLALACLFVAGEEISWGQRILGWGTPEAVETINHQDETTVHNVGRLQDVFNVVLLCGALYGVVAAWLAARRVRPWRDLPWLALPPLFLTGALVVVLGYRVLRFVIFVEPHYGVVKFGEWPELCFASTLAAFTFLVRRRLELRLEEAVEHQLDDRAVGRGGEPQRSSSSRV